MKVLIITYYWPPSGGSGVQRWMYFAKYLQEFGIEPIVITVDEKQASYPSLDFSLNKNVENIEVHKTKTLELIRFYSFLKSGNSKKSIPQGNVGNSKKSFFDKIATKIRANYFIPDARIGWNYYAYKEAKKVIENNKIDLVITTGPPHSTHLVGLKLKKNFNMKWIADFRDPWTEIYYNDIFKRTKKKTDKDKNLELAVLNSCDLVLTIGPSMKDLLAKKVDANKIEFIYNGFDEAKMSQIIPNKKQKFTLAHIGLLSEKQAYLSLAEGINYALKKYNDLEIDLIIAGDINSKVLDTFYGIEKLNVDYIGKIQHQEALQLMFDVHLLTNCLAILKESKILVSGKLMEYLATGNPILLIGDKDGDAAKLMNENPESKTFDQEEIELIADFIYLNFTNFKNQKINKIDIAKFSRFETTKQLSELIKKV